MGSEGSREQRDRGMGFLKLPSPATVIAVVSLFVALGTAAYAVSIAPPNSVTAKSIRKNAVRSVDVKDNALGGADVDESSLGEVPSATAAGSAAVAESANQLGGAPANSYIRFNGSTIPSGATVVGAFEVDGGPAGPVGTGEQASGTVSFPAPTTTPVGDADVNFAPGPNAGDADASCSGTAGNPTAPAGKVCLYETSARGDGPAATGAGLSGATSRFGFQVKGPVDDGSGSAISGTWAYTAP